MEQDVSLGYGQDRPRRMIYVIVSLLLTSSLSAFADCTSPAAKEGAREYVSGEFRFCDGTRWVSMYTDTTAGACTVAGRMDWESAQSVYRYCNGTTWYRMRKPACTISSLTYQSKVTDATNLSTAMSIDLSEDGTKAYVVGQWNERVAIYNIASSPAAPTLVGVTPAISYLSESAMAIKRGNYVYAVARATDNLVIVDVSNPASPAYLSRYTAGNEMENIWGVDLSSDGQTAFTTSWGSGPSSDKCFIHAIDVSNPASPTLRSKLNLTDAMGVADIYCNNVKYRNGYLFLSFADNGLYVVNATNPAAMTYVGNAHASNDAQSEGLDISMDSKTAVTSSWGTERVHVWNITTPTSPAASGQIFDAAKFTEAYRLKITGNYALVSARADSTLTAVDFSNPASPSISASLTNATHLNGAFGVATYGRYAYVLGTYGNSLAVVDMGCDPLGSARLGTCTLTAAIQYFPEVKATGYCDGTYWRLMGYSQYD